MTVINIGNREYGFKRIAENIALPAISLEEYSIKKAIDNSILFKEGEFSPT